MNQKISVLIPTLGRDQVVIDTVQGLLLQTRVPDEIILMDQNQPGLPALDQALAQWGPRVRHLKSQTKGVVYNMNLLLQEAVFPIVLFLDDDIIPHPKLVEKHLLNYESPGSERLGGIAGRVEQPSGDLEPERITEVGQYHRWSGKVVANFNSLSRQECSIAPGGNMSFRKEALIRAGGFDLGFDGNSYFFEPDVCLRVKDAGYQIIFDPEAQVKHLMAPMGGARITDKAIHTFYFVKNGIRLYRRHSTSFGLPAFCLKMTAYAAAKSVKNQDPRILSQGIRAVSVGISQALKLTGNGDLPA